MKNKSSILWIFIVVFAMLAFAGCSDDDNDNPTGGGTPTFPTELVGVFSPTSVTVNGASQAVSDFYEWDDSTTHVHITIHDNGTHRYEELDVHDAVLYHDSGIFIIDGQHITAIVLTDEHDTALTVPDTTFSGTWAFSNNILTLTMIQNTDTVVLVDTKIP